MILVIIKCLFDLQIIYENKNAWIKILQSLLTDNFTMQASYFIGWCVYNHIEIQSKTILNLQLFLCIVSRQMEVEYIAKLSIWISIFSTFLFLLLLLLLLLLSSSSSSSSCLYLLLLPLAILFYQLITTASSSPSVLTYFLLDWLLLSFHLICSALLVLVNCLANCFFLLLLVNYFFPSA